MSRMLLCALALIGLACSAGRTGGDSSGVSAREPAILAITVITAADNATRLPGADIYIVHATGTARAGATDQFGRIELERASLNPDSSFLGVMVCHPVFYCGMLRGEDIHGRGEMTIALATRVVR